AAVVLVVLVEAALPAAPALPSASTSQRATPATSAAAAASKARGRTYELKDIVFPPCQSCSGLARIAAPFSCVSTATIHLRFGRVRKFELRGSRQDPAGITRVGLRGREDRGCRCRASLRSAC